MCKRKIRTTGGERLTLIYSVTIDELSEASLASGLESYGASVAVKESGEEICIRHITLRSAEIFSLTSVLSRNYVTPSTLGDVVYDWLCR
jgi:hypothetical protein